MAKNYIVIKRSCSDGIILLFCCASIFFSILIPYDKKYVLSLDEQFMLQ